MNSSLVFLFVFFLFVLLYFFYRSRLGVVKLDSYFCRGSLLSKAELSFYESLLSSLSGLPYVVFVKVRLLDVVSPKGKSLVAFNKIKAKHLDFILCDIKNISPCLAVELNDSSHLSFDRKKRDEFLSSVLQSAKLPLLVFPAKRVYDSKQINVKIMSILNKPVI
ncbi:MAG: DUF2726 domain-containing protein [Nitrospiraceae bacterium]|nr:DUF2726 domain-containing protein [Nitrospiraceae bacterium]